MAKHADHTAENVERAGVGHPHSGPHDVDHSDDHTHHVPPSTYYKVFAALMVLLVATVGAAEFELGRLNVVVALLIAVVKAVLIILFFMHVKYSSKLVWLFAVTAFVFVFIMFGLTMPDFFTRHWFDATGR